MKDDVVGECIECGGFIYKDDEYEDLEDGYFIDGCFIHAECLRLHKAGEEEGEEEE